MRRGQSGNQVSFARRHPPVCPSVSQPPLLLRASKRPPPAGGSWLERGAAPPRGSGRKRLASARVSNSSHLTVMANLTASWMMGRARRSTPWISLRLKSTCGGCSTNSKAARQHRREARRVNGIVLALRRRGPAWGAGAAPCCAAGAVCGGGRRRHTDEEEEGGGGGGCGGDTVRTLTSVMLTPPRQGISSTSGLMVMRGSICAHGSARGGVIRPLILSNSHSARWFSAPMLAREAGTWNQALPWNFRALNWMLETSTGT